jgi:hypothetical protein
MSELVSPASIASWPEPGAELPASIADYSQARSLFIAWLDGM